VTWNGESSALCGSHQPSSLETVIPLNALSGGSKRASARHCAVRSLGEPIIS
jgi:hypothetical protein